jgi:hypothetical protein
MSPRTNAIIDCADMLYRAAAECCRQHQRYSRLVDKGVSAPEQKSALEMAFMYDDLLGTAMQGYEDATKGAPARPTEDWWRRSNMLWHASREYIRRHEDCDRLARGKGHSKGELGEMAMEFDLEASALLALKMALDSYKAVRPEAE